MINTVLADHHSTECPGTDPGGSCNAMIHPDRKDWQELAKELSTRESREIWLETLVDVIQENKIKLCGCGDLQCHHNPVPGN